MSESKKTFYCPRCHEKLSYLDGTMVKLNGTLTADTFSVRAQFYLPAELGRYGAIVSGDLMLKEGARVEFSCPNARCEANFTARYNHDLAEIGMRDERGREYVVVFHKVFGKHATFVVDLREHTLTERHGEDANAYSGTFERPLNFFGV